MDDMKRWLAFSLALLLLIPAAAAGEEAFPYLTSDWAYEEVAKAVELGVVYDPYHSFWDTGSPIARGDFAANAAALVAKEFGANMQSYALITRYRGQGERDYFPYSAVDAAESLGILQGRGDDAYGRYDFITRQEAAVMLARTYRACRSAEPDALEPISFTDRDDIADWALDDVRLMSQLGVMTGVGEGRFDPQGGYTVEQGLISLLRLYEKIPFDGSRPENPFVLSKPEAGYCMTWDSSELSFAVETEDYYICAMMRPTGAPGLSPTSYDIYIIDQDLSLRSYPTPIISWSTDFRGAEFARPETPSISEDGTKLMYTATLEEDVYHMEDGVEPADRPLLFQKGVYTVTMDLATGEQTWTRADLG